MYMHTPSKAKIGEIFETAHSTWKVMVMGNTCKKCITFIKKRRTIQDKNQVSEKLFQKVENCSLEEIMVKKTHSVCLAKHFILQNFTLLNSLHR